MRALIGNIVKTEVADYPCATREEAEALFLTLRRPHPARTDAVDGEAPGVAEPPRRKPPHRAR